MFPLRRIPKRPDLMLSTLCVASAWVLLMACDRGAPPAPAVVPPIATTSVGVPAASASLAIAPVAAPSANACPPRKGKVRLAWNDAEYQLQSDTQAFSCLSDAERAAVGYVAATIPSQCNWISGPDVATSELMECKLTQALGLGYQCEAKHFAFLRQWLKDETPALCAKIPITAYAQTALSEVSLLHDDTRITVSYKATTTTGPMGEAWTWSEDIVFREKAPDALTIEQRKPVGKRKGQ